MKFKTILFSVSVMLSMCFNGVAAANGTAKAGSFNKEKDLLLAQFDCKTDVDDLHTVAALATLLSDSAFAGINYHAVAGAYGMQEGLYVPPNPLFLEAFGDNWTDAHANFEKAVEKVKTIVKPILANKGDVWIAEAGQSDFSAALIKAIQKDLPEIDTKQRFHVVQHSDWNEEVTTPECLRFVKTNADYHKIPDGNAEGNGTPGFRTPENIQLKKQIKNPKLLEIWQLAVDLSHQYNGKEGRYNNEAIAAGGVDFSDLSEACWILGLQDIKDVEAFFEVFGK
ncbi:hypothetical protein [Marinilabilia rubra]|uniref:Uncharacterized protein n=1 Tax=Marinilabilia rubra TaxID=2162893 RepID=A0A2U2B5P2_9BACT|nr:hypothetical protein [Marinilabilia rubra]PWD98399.1 hypothetical protein DDZ16_15845 [Marinilabilia rubra]